ncbi:MAG: signal peptidase I [Bacilli bacterium]|nr:signal peptidase I [Bacilli bacterium]
MKENKLKLYGLEVILLLILFVALFVSNNMTQPLLALTLCLYWLVVRKLFLRKQKPSLYEKEIMYLLIGLALLYVGLFYLMGLCFYTFSKQIEVFGLKSLFKNIIPITIIIIASEYIRNLFITQDGSIKIKKKEIDIPKFLMFINMVLVDLIVYRSVYNLTSLSGLLSLVGFILCASVACNLFYNYVTKRYGQKGIIGYRLITALYVYIIPVIPNMYIYFRSFLRMVYPYIMYLILEYGYTKEKYAVSYRDKQKNLVKITVILVLAGLFTMLISCQFRFGLIVIGSGSMEGTIDYGDAAIFESYKNQRIKKGDIIIYQKDDLRLIHRVIDIQQVNGEMRYFTKGDANDYVDSDYRKVNDIVGIYHFKIKYIGYPTLFVNDLFG